MNLTVLIGDGIIARRWRIFANSEDYSLIDTCGEFENKCLSEGDHVMLADSFFIFYQLVLLNFDTSTKSDDVNETFANTKNYWRDFFEIQKPEWQKHI